MYTTCFEIGDVLLVLRRQTSFSKQLCFKSTTQHPDGNVSQPPFPGIRDHLASHRGHKTLKCNVFTWSLGISGFNYPLTEKDCFYVLSLVIRGFYPQIACFKH